MDKQACLCLLVIFAFSTVYSQTLPPIPCPQYFRYEYSPTGQVDGVITLPYDGSGSLYLQVNASMKGYYGKERSNMKLALLTSPTSILQKQTPDLTYKLTFPTQESIPQITSIVFNKNHLCTGPPIQGWFFGSINLYVTYEYSPVLFRPKRGKPLSSLVPGVLDLSAEGGDYFYPLHEVVYDTAYFAQDPEFADYELYVPTREEILKWMEEQGITGEDLDYGDGEDYYQDDSQ